MNQSVRADASASTRGTIYQLCIALERGFRLKPGQKMLIEELGDVTIVAEEQVEVKHYSTPLTDNHPNFWNTLVNWTDSAFDATQFEALVLHTNQKFGDQSRLATWNSSDKKQRMTLLAAINSDLETDFVRRQQKSPCAPSKTLKQQRALLGNALSALEGIVDKVVIEAGADGLTDLYRNLCLAHAQHILDSNMERYMAALLGFVCRPGKAAGDRWEITREEFKHEVETLTSIYCSETREFPRVHFTRVQDLPSYGQRDDLFVQKMRDIGCGSRWVSSAIRDFEGTIATISEEFRNYTAARGRLDKFKDEVHDIFDSTYDGACLSPPLDDIACQRFYLQATTARSPDFPGYADSPSSFRNGLLHLRMDEDEVSCRWRLEKA